MIKVEKKYLDEIRSILCAQVPGCEVWAFGSRVDGSAQQYSDLDLAVIGNRPLDWRGIEKLKSAFSESNLPFMVDVLDWYAISPEFREIIEREYEVVQKGEKQGGRVSERKEYTIGEIGKIITGKTPSTKIPDSFDGSIPFVTPRDMDGRRIISKTERYLSEEGLQVVKNAYLPANSIMVSCIGSDMGKVAIAGRPCVTNQQINSIVVKEPNIPEFIYYNLSTRKVELKNIASGSAQPILNKKHFSDIKILLPEPDEQRAIAHVLGTLDDKIELNRRMNETLESMARALFKSWFVDFDPVRAKAEGRQPYGMDAETTVLFPDSFQDSPLGKIPDGWEVVKLGNLCRKPQYGYTASAKEEKIGPKFLRIKDINKQPWIDWPIVPYCEIPAQELQKYLLEPGDFLLARMADPGHGVLIEEKINAVFASYLIRFKPLSESIARYLQFWQKSSAYWNLINARKVGTTRASINAKLFSEFPLVKPPNRIIDCFSSIVTVIRQKIIENVNGSTILATIRDTLLPKLLSGQIRIKDAEKFIPVKSFYCE